MANKIKLTRGTKANIEANKSSLEPYQIVYATDTSEIGVKKANGNVDYFPDTARLENTASKLYGANNLAVPDLEGKEYLGYGDYRVYDNNGITIDYNVYNGIYTINGTWTGITGTHVAIPLTKVEGLTLTVSVELVSGVPPIEAYYRPSGLTNYQIALFEGIKKDVPYDKNFDYIRMANGYSFNNLQFRVQLEKGDTATPYTVPAPFLLPNDIPEWAKTLPPSAVRFMRMNANNTVTWRTAAQLRGDIGAATPANITTAVSNHNESPTAHQDIREYVDSKTMKLINSGSSTALSKTGYVTLTVPSDSYAGKTVAVEIRYGSSSATTYTNQVVYVTLGTNNTTTASKTYPRFITLSEWDGEYLKHISVKTYVATGTTSTINFGHVKTLIGRFTGSTIDWTTQANDNINVYIGKIWLVG